MKANTDRKIFRTWIPTPEGDFLAEYSERGLCALHFPSSKRPGGASDPVPANMQRWHALTRKAVAAVLQGKAPARLPPLDLSIGTNFQQEVWRALGRIGRGKTLSYGEVAKAIGRPNAVRAVGGACGANPLPLLIPCHRVLAAGRRLGGFSAGLDWKRRLLAKEGLAFATEGPAATPPPGASPRGSR